MWEGGEVGRKGKAEGEGDRGVIYGNEKEKQILDTDCCEKERRSEQTAWDSRGGYNSGYTAEKNQEHADWKDYKEPNQEGKEEDQGHEVVEEEGGFGSDFEKVE